MISKIYSINNPQTLTPIPFKSKYKGLKEHDSKIYSKPAFQVSSIMIGVAGIISLIKTKMLTAKIEGKFREILGMLNEQIPNHLKQTTRIQLMFEKLANIAMKDGLTGVYNRKTFDSCFSRAIETAKINKKPLSVIFMDLDYFKSVNDILGHNIGDEFLKTLCKIANNEAEKKGAFLGRIGGEEFAIFVPNASGNEAKDLITNICEKLKETNSIQGKKPEILELLANKIKNAPKEDVSKYQAWNDHISHNGFTLSAGIVEYDSSKDISHFKLLQQADKALYKAKEKRNSIIVGSLD